MSEPGGGVALPDEILVSLAVLTELFGAVDQALLALRAAGLEPAATRLDDALGRVSQEVVDRLGFFYDEGQ